MPANLRTLAVLSLACCFAVQAAVAAQPQPGTQPVAARQTESIQAFFDEGPVVNTSQCQCSQVLLRQAALAVDKKQANELAKAVKFLEDLGVSPLQIENGRGHLLNARNQVLTSQQFLTNALDLCAQVSPLQIEQAKGQLPNARNWVLANQEFVAAIRAYYTQGLWQVQQSTTLPSLPSEWLPILDAGVCRNLTSLLDRHYEVLGEAEAVCQLVTAREALAPQKLRPFLLGILSKDNLVRGTSFPQKLLDSWDRWATVADVQQRLDDFAKQRDQWLQLWCDLESKTPPETLSAEQAKNLKAAEFEVDVGSLELALRHYEARPWQRAENDQRGRIRTELLRKLACKTQSVLAWPLKERFASLAELWPAVPTVGVGDTDLVGADVDQAQEVAAKAALANLGLDPLILADRVESMNAGAPWADTYRQGRRGIALAVRLDADVRYNVRQLQHLADNYKIQKKVLASLYSQVASGFADLFAPSDAGQIKPLGTTSTCNPCALINQYLTTLESLDNAQIKMYDLWLTYLTTRWDLCLSLDRLPAKN
jgi:hypothetical protein